MILIFSNLFILIGMIIIREFKITCVVKSNPNSQPAISTQKKRLSRRLSCSVGTALETPGEVLFPSKDTANAFAAVQRNRLRQRLNHASRTYSQTLSGADSAVAFDSALKNLAVSPVQLASTSPPRTTRRARLLHPSSGFTFSPPFFDALTKPRHCNPSPFFVPSRHVSMETPSFCGRPMGCRRRWSGR